MILAQKVSKSKCDSPLTKADIVKSFHVVVEKYSCDSSKVFAISLNYSRYSIIMNTIPEGIRLWQSR